MILFLLCIKKNIIQNCVIFANLPISILISRITLLTINSLMTIVK